MASETAPLSPARAIDLFDGLLLARKQNLQPSLREAVERVGVETLNDELDEYAPSESLTKLASLGLRGELIFPVPAVIEAKPSLIGYYRMLIGVSQKAFSQMYGYGRFASAERKGVLSSDQAAELPELCRAFAAAASALVDTLDSFTARDLSDLTLLTLGSTLYGSHNNQIGAVAVQGVFQAIGEALADFLQVKTGSEIRLKNPAERDVLVKLGSDPDVAVLEQVGDSFESRIAIEVKGGTDVSNLHNCLGEAEKSHLKCSDFRERWTLIHPGRFALDELTSETPSTDRFFDVGHVIRQEG